MNQGGEHFVRIRRVLMRQRNFPGKVVYKNNQLEITIPSKFNHTVESFMNKDLKVETKFEGDSLVIELQPVENIV
jgi:hypothetical protein